MDPSSKRLASFLASYSALWTISYPELLKLAIAGKHSTRLGDDSSKWKMKMSQFLSDWAAAGAGAIAGLAILIQTREERLNLGPNIFCRGLYTVLTHRPLFRVPYGDVLLFGLSNAQIMSAFILYPETLPAWYWHWIRRVGRLEIKFLDVHRRLNLDLPVSKDTIDELIKTTSRKNRSRQNQMDLDRWFAGSNRLPSRRPCTPCHLNHPLSDTCWEGNLLRSWDGFKMMVPTYAILHLIPSLLFRSKVLMKFPLQFLFSFIKKTASSALFISTFVWIILHSVCIPSRIYDLTKGKIAMKGWSWHSLIGFSTALSLFWEDPRRRGELALYCAPKALSSMWQVLKAKKIVKSVAYGEVLLTSLGCGMMMNCFVHSSDQMTSLIRGIIAQLVDPHIPDSFWRKRGSRREDVKPDPELGLRVYEELESRDSTTDLGCLERDP